MNEQILALLLAKGLIDEKTVGIVNDVLTRGKTLEQAVVGARYVSDADFAKAKAEALGLSFQDLAGWDPTPETAQLLPADIVENQHALALGFEAGVLMVALLDPQDLRATQAVEFFAAGKGWKVKFVLVPSVQLRKLLKVGSVFGSEMQTAMKEAEAAKEADALGGTAKGLEEIIKGAPVARMLTTIMHNAVDQNASDIHIEISGGESRVRYRIDGVLRTVLTLPVAVHPALIARVKVLANLKLDETRIPQDGRITQAFSGKKIDFRISTLPVVDHEKVVMRVLDTSVGAPTLERLGYRAEHVETIHQEIKKNHGLLLVTGPTGSGKSTTLFACLNLLNNEGVNIETLEDPVEYYIQGVNQSQIRPEIGYTFATGLRSLLRQDPNVIMVGEIRDKETAELAIHASLTGHLVFSTLHTNDVLGLVPRLLDMGVEAYLLAATLNVGIAQRLARRTCEHCKEPYVVDPKTLAQVVEEMRLIPDVYFPPGFDRSKPMTFMAGKGCARCGHTGYNGRVAVAEVLPFSGKIQELIQEGFRAQDAKKEIRAEGVITLREDGWLKALAGFTTVEEIFRITQETTEEDSV